MTGKIMDQLIQLLPSSVQMNLAIFILLSTAIAGIALNCQRCKTKKFNLLQNLLSKRLTIQSLILLAALTAGILKPLAFQTKINQQTQSEHSAPT